MTRLVISGKLPGLNEYIAAERDSRFKGAQMRREAEKRVEWAARAQLRGVHFERPVIMRYTWVEPNRRRDKDNIAFAKKFIQDALVRIGVLKNDGWSFVTGFTDGFSVDKKRPRVEVEFEEV